MWELVLKDESVVVPGGAPQSDLVGFQARGSSCFILCSSFCALEITCEPVFGDRGHFLGSGASVLVSTLGFSSVKEQPLWASCRPVPT